MIFSKEMGGMLGRVRKRKALRDISVFSGLQEQAEESEESYREVRKLERPAQQREERA